MRQTSGTRRSASEKIVKDITWQGVDARLDTFAMNEALVFWVGLPLMFRGPICCLTKADIRRFAEIMQKGLKAVI